MLVFRAVTVGLGLLALMLPAAKGHGAQGGAGGMYGAYSAGPSDDRLFDRAFDTRPAANPDELVRTLSRAIDMLSRYRVPKELPRIYRVPRAELENYVCGTHCGIQAWYKPGDGIFLDDTLQPETNLMHRSILLHELVHYFQDVAGSYGERSSCERWFQREIDAYSIQNRYLGVIGHPSRVAYAGDNCENMENRARRDDGRQTFSGAERPAARP
jgi:hypothetical protein